MTSDSVLTILNMLLDSVMFSSHLQSPNFETQDQGVFFAFSVPPFFPAPTPHAAARQTPAGGRAEKNTTRVHLHLRVPRGPAPTSRSHTTSPLLNSCEKNTTRVHLPEGCSKKNTSRSHFMWFALLLCSIHVTLLPDLLDHPYP